MAEEHKNLRLEIAHVLFVDIVGYSKLLTEEQSEALHELNQIVRKTEAVRKAETAGELILLPTGDGMALAFTGSVEDPVECALQISQALRAQPNLPVRMGIHSGPVHHVTDVNQRENIAGAGINMAQRIMDCGDAGHILLSKRVADDLAQYRRWQLYLHELGNFEVKHGVVVSVVNLSGDELGNPEVPAKLAQLTKAAAAPPAPVKQSRISVPLLLFGFLLFTLAVLGIIFAAAILRQTRAPAPKSPAPSAPSSLIPEKSIAVLPFENLSEEKANAFFADGVQDEILTDLAKIADLKVISRSSVMHYKSGVERNLRQIGQQLGVAHLLEGNVQRAANRVRVNAQLIDARTDAHLWAQTYDRELADVFAIQSEIAKAIADQLQAKLSPSEKAAIEQPPTSDVAAFDLYSRARALLLDVTFTAVREDNARKAVDLLNQAVARDPAFAVAYCRLTEAHDTLYTIGGDHTPARLALAEAAMKRAVQLQPDSGETHLSLARHRYYAYRDYDGARAELAVAERSLPNEPAIPQLASLIDRRRGRWDDSVREAEHSIELDPRNVFTMQQTALTYQHLRHFPQMAAILDRALSVDPRSIQSRIARAQVELHWHANPEPLRTTIGNILTEDPSSAPIVAENWMNVSLCARDTTAATRAIAALGSHAFGSSSNGFSSVFGEGLIAQMRGDATTAQARFSAARAQQEQAVREQPDYAPALCVLGIIDAMLGRKEEAMSEGRRAMELLPVEKDAVAGSEIAALFAIICVWSGDRDVAIRQLELVTRIPCYLSYGLLKLEPYWDPLRGDPRFEKIVASLAPKS